MKALEVARFCGFFGISFCYEFGIFSSGKSGASGSGKDLNDKLQDYLKKAKERQKKSSSDKKKWGVCKCIQTFLLCKKILQIYAKANEGKSIMQLFVKKSLPS